MKFVHFDLGLIPGKAVPARLMGVLLLATLWGCGLSYDYQRSSLENAGPSALCYAATDPRTGGFAVRREAAQDLIDERGISCDYAGESSVHAGQAEAQQMGIATSLGTITAGARLASPPPIPDTYYLVPARP